ncbi:MAG TPA: YicC family protein [Tissierellia bacterium]|nr:YicC family protein [Tissierellia bacterium]
MLKSMTGFGRHQIEREDYSLKIEMKSVNSRYLDIHFRMPKLFNAYEELMRNQIAQTIRRGKVDLFIEFHLRAGAGVTIEPNLDLAAKYVAAYRSIAKHEHLSQDIPMELLAAIPEMLSVTESDIDEESLQQDITAVLKTVLDQLDEMRSTEGQNLKQDLLNRAGYIEQAADRIAKKHPQILRQYKDQMAKRLQELIEQPEVIDNERLEIELAIYAEKKDIQEELTRIASHLGQFEQILSAGGEVGRTLDFLSQELNREINTIGSKASGYDISREVIELKSQLDKIREQIQNVE